MTATNEGSQTRLWGGRFGGGPSPAMAALSKSTDVDWRLAPFDLASSRAHARVLNRAGLLTDDELAAMLGALTELSAEVVAGTFAVASTTQDRDRVIVEKPGPTSTSLAPTTTSSTTAGNPVPDLSDLSVYLIADEHVVAAGREVGHRRRDAG